MGRGHFGVPARRVLAAGFLGPAAWMLAGCGSGGDLISTVALPSQQTTGYDEGVDLPLPPEGDRQSGKPELTPAQRDYLGALANAGIHPTNELRVLSIGSYVCQARAAGQSDQAVWDSVAPMVRSAVSDTHGLESPEVSYHDVDATIGHYIGTAIKRLC